MKNRIDLKKDFESGQQATEQKHAELIDSTYNKTDDSVLINENGVTGTNGIWYNENDLSYIEDTVVGIKGQVIVKGDDVYIFKGINDFIKLSSTSKSELSFVTELPEEGESSILYVNTTDNMLYYWNETEYILLYEDMFAGATCSFDGSISTNLIPDIDDEYSLGTPTKKFKELYVSDGSIYIGNTKLSSSGDGLKIENVTNPETPIPSPIISNSTNKEFIQCNLSLQSTLTTPGTYYKVNFIKDLKYVDDETSNIVYSISDRTKITLAKAGKLYKISLALWSTADIDEDPLSNRVHLELAYNNITNDYLVLELSKLKANTKQYIDYIIKTTEDNRHITTNIMFSTLVPETFSTTQIKGNIIITEL